MGVLRAIPLLVPGSIFAVTLGLVLAVRVGRYFHTDPVLAALLIVSVGAIAAATLTPSGDALSLGRLGSGSCDLSRIGLASPRDLQGANDTSLNILLFVPLGVALGFMPRHRRARLLLIAALALPFAIEMTQLVVLPLDRGCESADVFDNLTGLVPSYFASVAIRGMAGRRWTGRGAG